MATDDTNAPAQLGDALTEAELAYMASGGEKTDGLIAANSTTAAAVTEPARAPDAGKASPDGAAANAGAGPDGEPGVGAAAAATVDPTADAGDDDDDEVEAAADPKGGKAPPKTVSFHKFERIRKKLQTQLETRDREMTQLREQFSRGDERLKLLTEALAVPEPGEKKPADDPAPDPQADIFAYVAWQGRQMQRLQDTLNGTRQEVTTTRQAVSERDMEAALKTEYQTDAMSFARENPDFGAAYAHLLNSRGAMLEAQGYDNETIKKTLIAEERGLVERAKATGKRPAQMVYELAKHLGYRKTALVPAQATASAPAPAAAQPTAAAAVQPAAAAAAPSVTEEIERIRAGQAAGKTLSGAGGAADELSLAGLATMSEADFNAFYAKNRSKVDAMMGQRH